MATVAGMNRTGICSNFGNCTIADARSTVELTTGMDFVCTECGKPLLLKDGDRTGVGGQSWLIVVGIVLVLVLAGGGIWMFGSKTNVDGTSKPAPAVPGGQPAAPSGTPAGDCSLADEKAGVCKMQR